MSDRDIKPENIVIEPAAPPAPAPCTRSIQPIQGGSFRRLVRSLRTGSFKRLLIGRHAGSGKLPPK